MTEAAILGHGRFVTNWPMGAQILHGGMQGDDTVVWFRCDPGQDTVERRFIVLPTGHEVQDDDAAGWIHRVTFQVPTPTMEIVVHLMEIP